MSPIASITVALAWFNGDLFAPENLAMLLWGGLAVLTVALLVLMKTRWGQAAPLSKCIVLSVFAHILFFTYAYGTKLILDYPVQTAEPYIRLKVLAADEDWETEKESRPEEPPWDEFASQVIAPPMLTRPQPQAVETTTRDITFAVPDMQFTSAIDTAAVNDDEPDRPEPETVGSIVPAPKAAPPSTEIETETRRQSEQAATLSPLGVDLPRRGLPHRTDVATLPLARETASDVLDSASDLQRLAERQLSDGLADAVADRQDALHEATNLPDALSEGGTRPDRPTREGGVQPESDTDVDTLLQYHFSDHRPGDGLAARSFGEGDQIPDLYAHRTQADRMPLLERYGGTPLTEDAVAESLDWLAANQEPDGRWDADQHGAGRESRVLGHDRRAAGAEADTAITGLALLALLGSGQTHFEGTYRQNVQKGLEYLLRMQGDDGNLSGRASLFARMYCHGIATLAISEAYAVTGDRRLKPYVSRAIGYTIGAQHPSGGWRYQPGDQGDMSQFGWQLMALKSASLAGIPFPGGTRASALRFLGSVSSGTHSGRASYRRGEVATRAMTAEALACRFFLGSHRNNATVREAADFVTTELPGQGRPNLYYWYYATLAMFQVQGDSWHRWNEALQEALLSRQRTDGTLAGSWDPDTVWGNYGGRVYSTAMATLCLEVYYRYLPVYETTESAAQPSPHPR
jgi:hypothetical protein